jgi:hypothetical protein
MNPRKERRALVAADLVTLKARRSRIQRSTDMPRGGISCWLTRTNSRMELITTKKSNLKKGILKIVTLFTIRGQNKLS